MYYLISIENIHFNQPYNPKLYNRMEKKNGENDHRGLCDSRYVNKKLRLMSVNATAMSTLVA